MPAEKDCNTPPASVNHISALPVAICGGMLQHLLSVAARVLLWVLAVPTTVMKAVLIAVLSGLCQFLGAIHEGNVAILSPAALAVYIVLVKVLPGAQLRCCQVFYDDQLVVDKDTIDRHTLLQELQATKQELKSLSESYSKLESTLALRLSNVQATTQAICNSEQDSSCLASLPPSSGVTAAACLATIAEGDNTVLGRDSAEELDGLPPHSGNLAIHINEAFDLPATAVPLSPHGNPSHRIDTAEHPVTSNPSNAATARGVAAVCISPETSSGTANTLSTANRAGSLNPSNTTIAVSLQAAVAVAKNNSSPSKCVAEVVSCADMCSTSTRNMLAIAATAGVEQGDVDTFPGPADIQAINTDDAESGRQASHLNSDGTDQLRPTADAECIDRETANSTSATTYQQPGAVTAAGEVCAVSAALPLVALAAIGSTEGCKVGTGSAPKASRNQHPSKCSQDEEHASHGGYYWLHPDAIAEYWNGKEGTACSAADGHFKNIAADSEESDGNVCNLLGLDSREGRALDSKAHSTTSRTGADIASASVGSMIAAAHATAEPNTDAAGYGDLGPVLADDGGDASPTCNSQHQMDSTLHSLSSTQSCILLTTECEQAPLPPPLPSRIPSRPPSPPSPATFDPFLISSTVPSTHLSTDALHAPTQQPLKCPSRLTLPTTQTCQASGNHTSLHLSTLQSSVPSTCHPSSPKSPGTKQPHPSNPPSFLRSATTRSFLHNQSLTKSHPGPSRPSLLRSSSSRPFYHNQSLTTSYPAPAKPSLLRSATTHHHSSRIPSVKLLPVTSHQPDSPQGLVLSQSSSLSLSHPAPRSPSHSAHTSCSNSLKAVARSHTNIGKQPYPAPHRYNNCSHLGSDSGTSSAEISACSSTVSSPQSSPHNSGVWGETTPAKTGCSGSVPSSPTAKGLGLWAAAEGGGSRRWKF